MISYRVIDRPKAATSHRFLAYIKQHTAAFAVDLPGRFTSPDDRTPMLLQQFRTHVEDWEQNRPKGADLHDLVTHPAYQAIIGMGPVAIPLLLRELERKPGHWFWALHCLTAENPVPPGSEGKMIEMAAAWLTWGKARGYLDDAYAVVDEAGVSSASV